MAHSRDVLSSRPFLRYLLVGGACYLSGLVLLAALVEFANVNYLIANVISLAVLVVIGHYANRTHTFASHRHYGWELVAYAFAIMTQAAAALLLIWYLVEHVYVSYLVANVIATAIFTVLSYLIQRDWVFRAKR